MSVPHPSNQLVANLFRHEAGRMIATLTRMLGFDRLELAEDIVQDTMVQALHSWPFQGIPEQPSAWLYRVAKNKALDVVRRENLFRQISQELSQEPEPEEALVEPFFVEHEINDSQLRMLFACCHPSLSLEMQLAICLKLLCGLSVREIAGAFLTAPDTIEKRLYRVREKIRSQGIRLEVPSGSSLAQRRAAGLKVVYLLFTEGYTSDHPDQLIRQDLCAEALRLGLLLQDHPRTVSPEGYALLALMCFQAARFEARTDDSGSIILLPDQDRSRWNQDLIARGLAYLHRSAEGQRLSEYHLEAAIARLHCQAPSYADTDWPQVLQYYDRLLTCKPSPVVALNRAVALAQAAGPAAALAEVVSLSGLDRHPYYHAILGDLYQQNGQPSPARRHYELAMQLTPSTAEKALLSRKIGQLPG